MRQAHVHFLKVASIVFAIMLVAAVTEFCMGRRVVSASGSIRLWVGSASGPETSQQLSDWYSFTHVIHGFILFAIFRFVGRRWNWSLGTCLIAAVVLEASWEMLENSSFIIDRYRRTMAETYEGDTILNSMSDIGFAIFGFLLAARLPAWATISLIVLMELGVGYAIHDNLTLNIIMLIHPFGSIRHWQMGR